MLGYCQQEQTDVVVYVRWRQPCELLVRQSGCPAAGLPQNLQSPTSILTAARYWQCSPSLTTSVWRMLPVLVLFLTFVISSVVLQGCLYGEGKVVQTVSDGGFEPASYFTNPSASHSTGKTAMKQSKDVHMLKSEGWLDGRTASETLFNNFRNFPMPTIQHSNPLHAIFGQLCVGVNNRV